MSMINYTSGEVREAIKRKSPLGMPDNPTQRGWKPDEIRRQFTQFVISDTVPPDVQEDGTVVIHERNSILGEIDRVVSEINGYIASVGAKDGEQDAAIAGLGVSLEELGRDLAAAEQELLAVGQSVTSLQGLDVRAAIKAALNYVMDKALFETQAEALAYNVLYQAALPYLGGNWLTGEGGYVPPVNPDDPGGGESFVINALGDWVILQTVPASMISVMGDWVIINNGGTR